MTTIPGCGPKLKKCQVEFLDPKGRGVLQASKRASTEPVEPDRVNS